MKGQFLFLGRIALFWILVFFILRMGFLLLNAGTLADSSPSLILRTFLMGEIMDLSVTSYILFFLIVLFFLTIGWKASVYEQSVRVTVIILVILSTLLAICDAGLYRHWGTRLNEKALSVLLYPSMALDAVKSTDYVLLLALLFLLCGSLIWLSRFFIHAAGTGSQPKAKIAATIASLIIIPLLVIAARGGIQKYPLGKSTLFFSDNFTCNYATLNPLWNVADVVINLGQDSRNDYQYYPAEVVKREMDSLFPLQDTCPIPAIFSGDRPNFVLILLESFSAGTLPALGGLPAAVNLNGWCDSAVCFSNFYASGFRSEQALIAIMSGMPPLPGGSLLREGNRVIRLPLLGKILKDSLSYNLRFYNTYDARYARMIDYLTFSGFDRIVSGEAFADCSHHQWGAYDECLFDYVLEDLSASEAPFFSLVLTSVSHEPFNAEVDQKFPGNTDESRYLNTVAYTDSCLGDFLNRAREKPWYANTVFMILADHGHAFPGNHDTYDPLRYRIPFLMLGPPLKREYTGKWFSHPASQTDIAATILHQVGLGSASFPFSRDLMGPGVPWQAFYSFSDGFGYVEEGMNYAYSKDLKRVIRSTPQNSVDSMDLFRGKVILQAISGELTKLN